MNDIHMSALLSHGAACVRVAKRGKLPIGRAWSSLASTAGDVISQWLRSGYNVGILLGHGGLVDVEFDCSEGRAALGRMGLLEARTPTWASSRGEHRLFRVLEPLPKLGWRTICGVEFRIGGKPAQSVLPPSRHPDGVGYRWTISPADCAPAAISLAELGVA